MNRQTKALQVVTPAMARQQELRERVAALSAKVKPTARPATTLESKDAA